MIFRKNRNSNWKLNLIITIILFHVLSGSIFSQRINQNFEKLSNTFDTLSQNQAQELIYLQTSKGMYETGEDLWFKAYVINSQYLIPTLQSKTLWLQMVNKKNMQAVWQEKYEINSGFANGHVFINDTLSEGTYLLIACTGKSIFQNDKEFKAFRVIEIKKDLKPHVKVTTDFDRPFFDKGDSITLTVTAINEQQKPQYAQLIATLFQEGQELEKLQTTTSQTNGTANFCFNPVHTSKGLKLKIEAKHSEASEEIQLAVPFHVGCPIQFGMFPEGGNLVHGLKSKVAFKAVNLSGNPEKVEGILYENNDTLLKFRSVHDGMGSFSFVPDAEKNYTVKLTASKTDSLFALPEIHPKGLCFQLTKRDSSFLWFQVQQSSDLPETKIYLRGQSRGVVYCMASGTLQNKLDIKIPLNQFPLQGIAEFTLFNSNLQPVAERLVYVNPDNKLNIETKLSKEKYSTREKVKIELKVSDQNGQSVIANLGVSVFDKIYRNHADKKNMLTHCHLFTQLKGNIYNPVFYFNKTNHNRFEALDLLMLTQGWRRYVWSETALKERDNKRHTVIEDGVNGQLFATKKQKKASLEGQFIMAHNPGENNGMDLLETTAGGKFSVLPTHFKNWQGGYVYLKPMGNEDFRYKLKLSTPFDSINVAIGQEKLLYPQYKASKKELPQVRAFVPGPNVIELDEVTIKGKTRAQFRDKYLGQLDSITKLDLSNVWACCHDYLENYKEGYSHGCDNCGDSIRRKPIEGKKYTIIRYEYVGRSDGKKIVTDVQRNIEYHYPKFTEEELLEMNNLSRVKAYYGKREFYKPHYDKKEELNNMIPDFRNTLVWEPTLITDKNGEATLEFFCSDIFTGFTGIIEGLNGSGQLGYKEFEFTVRKTKRFEWER